MEILAGYLYKIAGIFSFYLLTKKAQYS